ncbi:MAG: hypothetical protein R3F19_13285 [Verrucomicrobiales bacterium]
MGDHQCIECRGNFAADELLSYGEHTVCPQCKERLLDKLKQGLPAGAGPWSHRRMFNGPLIVFPRGRFRFPSRCLKCNAPATHSVNRVLRWSPSFHFVASMDGFGQLARLPLCDEHQKRCEKFYRWRYLVVALFVILVGILVIVLLASEFRLGQIVAIGVINAAIFSCRALMGRWNVLRVKRMEDDYIYAEGVGRAYWESLVPFRK